MSLPVDLRTAPLDRPVRIPDGNCHEDPLTFTFGDDDDAIDLTDAEVLLVISDCRGGAAVVSGGVIDDRSESGVLVPSPATGQATIWVTAADVETLGLGKHYYSLRITFPDDHSVLPSMNKELVAGTFAVTEGAIGAP